MLFSVFKQGFTTAIEKYHDKRGQHD